MNEKQKSSLPSALEKKDEILKCLCERRPAIFLDYDGTLTPIVEDPSEARLPERTRQLIKKAVRTLDCGHNDRPCPR
jgi:trehalose 6-phosphate phosphatase